MVVVPLCAIVLALCCDRLGDLQRLQCSLGCPTDALSMKLQSVDETCRAGVTRLEGDMHTQEMVARTDPQDRLC